MKGFAKLYNTAELGQIMVMVDSNYEGKPEVKTYFTTDNMGVCSTALEFKDDDDGWESARKLFDNTNSEKAQKTVLQVLAFWEE